MPNTLDATIFCGIGLPRTPAALAAASTLHPHRDNTLLLNEYLDKDVADITNTPGAKYTRYVNIEGLEGSTFEVYVRVSNSYTWDHQNVGRTAEGRVETNHELYVNVSIDGTALSYCTPLDKSYSMGKIDYDYFTSDGAGWSKKKFLFGKLDIVDKNTNHNTHLTKERAAKMGQIIIDIYRVDVEDKPTGAIIQQNHQNMEAITKVDEKKIKGLGVTHGVQFGASEPIASHPFYGKPGRNRTWIDGKNKPFVTFHYFYRSKSALQSLCILPRDPDEQDIRLSDSHVASSMSRRAPNHGRDKKRIKLDDSSAPSSTGSKEVPKKAPKDNRDVIIVETKDSHASSSRGTKKSLKRGYIDLTLDD